MSLPPDDPDLTSSLLGEASPARTAAVDAVLRRDPALRREAAEIQASADLLGSVLRRHAPVFTLTEERRASILRGETRPGALPETAPVTSWQEPRLRSVTTRSIFLHPGVLTGGIAAALALGLYALPGIRGAWDWKDAPVAAETLGDAPPREGLIRVTPGQPRKMARNRPAQQPAPPENSLVPADPPAPEVPAMATMPPGAQENADPSARPLPTPPGAPVPAGTFTADAAPPSGTPKKPSLLKPEHLILPSGIGLDPKGPVLGMPPPGRKGKEARKEEKKPEKASERKEGQATKETE